MFRGYAENKIHENTSAEILQVVLNETEESYAPEIVVQLPSNGELDGEMDENVNRIEGWIRSWKENGGGEAQPVGRRPEVDGDVESE